MQKETVFWGTTNLQVIHVGPSKEASADALKSSRISG